MEMTLKKGIVAVVTVLGASAVPVIPQDMELLYSYQYPAGLTETVQTTATGTVTNKIPTLDFKDDDKNGTISVSVFADKNGNLTYTQIPDTKYVDMGKVNGTRENPTKNEFVSAYSLLIPQAEAAIAFDTATGAQTNSATSLTWAHITSGSDRILWVYTMNNSARAISGVTYNGSAMTNFVADAQTQKSQLWYIIAPTTGSNNVVVTVGGAASYIYCASASYTGVAQSSPTDGSDTTGSVTDTQTSTIVTTVDNDWTVLGARQTSSGNTAASTGSTDRYDSAGYVQFYDSGGAITPAGSYSMVTTQISGQTNHVMAAFKPATGGGGTPVKRQTEFFFE